MNNANIIKSPSFMIIPSLSCQASCKYCFGPNKGKVMNNQMVEKCLDYIERVVGETGQEKVNITLHGGEPLTAGYSIIEAILCGIAERFNNANVSMQSNLWLLDDRYCQLFLKHNVAIGTSLDGTKQINDIQRGQGYFDKTFSSINLARHYGFNVGCIATFTALSAPKYREVLDFFLSNNINFSIHGAVNANKDRSDFEITPKEYETLLINILDWYKDNSQKQKISTLDQLCQSVHSGIGKVCSFCDCFGMFVAIDPNGDIFSCQRFAGNRGYSLGNVLDDPSVDDLVSSDMGQKLLKRQVDVERKCAGCEHYNYCKGGCAFNALIKNKVIDEYCDTYKSIFSYIKTELYNDMINEENENAIKKYGISPHGNPLLRKGKIIDISKENAHPYDVSRRAKRIVACYELAQNNDFDQTEKRLFDMGIGKSHKTLKNSLTTLKQDIDNVDRLNKLYIHITWNCQLNCEHCYANAGENRNTANMKSESILSLINQGSDIGFDAAVITGGEPLLLNECEKFLKCLVELTKSKKLCKTVLRTNFAMPLSFERLSLVGQAFDEIVISIDGDRTSHDKRRGKGSYVKTVENIEKYTSLDNNRFHAKLVLSSCLLYDEVISEKGHAVKALADRFNIKKVKYTPILPLGRAESNKELCKNNVFKLYKQPIDILEDKFTPFKTCGIGQNLYVQPTGDAYPCYAYCPPHSYLGNAVIDGLERIINSDRFKQLREYSVDTNEKCKLCNYRYLCGGMCKALCGDKGVKDINKMHGDCTTMIKNLEALYNASLEYLDI